MTDAADDRIVEGGVLSMHRAFSVAATGLLLSLSLASPVVAADSTGSMAPSTAPPTAGAADVTPSPTTSLLDPMDWATYTSDQYGYSIGYPPDWTVLPAERDWTFEADAADRASPAMERFISPDGTVGVGVWSVSLDPDAKTEDWGFEPWSELVPWVESYCEATGNTPCSGSSSGPCRSAWRGGTAIRASWWRSMTAPKPSSRLASMTPTR